MEILQRTQGIDPKAHDSVLHGHVSLVLKDALTGKIKEKVEKDNFFTLGLDSAVNGCPFGLNQDLFGEVGRSGSYYNFSPIITQLLGGITLYPQSLGDSTGLLFPPFSNMPTGYASMDSYTQDDNKQGTYDSVSSGAITNGYKHVYDWGSAFGNGQIASIALNPRGSYKWCKDFATAINPTIYAGTGDAQNGIGFGGFPMWNSGDFVIAVCDNGMLWRYDDGTTHEWRYAKVAPFNIDLINPYTFVAGNGTCADQLLTPLWALSASTYGNYDTWQFIDNQLVYISRNNNTFTVTYFDMSDGSVDSTETYTFSGASFGSGGGCICGDYLYWGSSTAGKFYKCNLNDTSAAPTEITSTNIPANSQLSYVGTQFIYNTRGIYDTANDVFVETAQDIMNAGYIHHLFDTGIWMVTSSHYPWYNANRRLGATMKTWACMTHANLENAVTKTADKQMVVNYSILQS